ncbi:hypothetical protein QJS10_CPA10g01803 [Acorus calamus]|uniref:DCD domain-containing protein n=1 Tax=Acorus calamus TaxID=4465 RepID=A0AAV9E1S6_ACOCL|nr:hypothetical protein QJS10_CPA10g01803 [Acorus calamus]
MGESSRHTAPPRNISAPARRLSKKNLGGVIFGCKHSTMAECLSKKLFGSCIVVAIVDRKLHGIFEAASSGQMDIDSYGWTGDGAEMTPYPAQVRFCISMHCHPLTENQFRHVIVNNYYSPSHFWFELDHAQAEGLKALFVPVQTWLDKNPYSQPNAYKPIGIDAGAGNLKSVPKTVWNDVYDKRKQNVQPLSTWKPIETNKSFFSENKFDKLGKDTGDKAISSQTSSVSPGDDEPSLTISDMDSPDSNNTMEHTDSNTDAFSSGLTNHTPYLNGEDRDKPHYVEELVEDDVNVILGKLKNLAENLISDTLLANSTHHPDPTKLDQVLKEFRALTLKQYEENKALQEKQVHMEKEAQRLKNRIKYLEYKIDLSLTHVDESQNELIIKHKLMPEDYIYLVGGIDDATWLSAVNSFAPSLDMLTSLRPMCSARAYASAVALSGSLYVFGGYDGTLCYKTVECYDPKKDEWTSCSSLVRERSSLAGVSLHDKIFAVGGGYMSEFLSDVEMFDPALNRWINMQPMYQKRLAPAAAELNDILYVAGGYDGIDYLKYALGGNDGANLLSSIEMFDPHMNKWMMVEPMNKTRVYAGAAVLGGSMYVMGGETIDGDILDTVECYKEGAGWQLINSKAIGKRCMFSADNRTDSKILLLRRTPHFESILRRDSLRFITRTKAYLSLQPEHVLLLDEAGKLHRELGFPRGRKVIRSVHRHPSLLQTYRHGDGKVWIGFTDLMEDLLREEASIMDSMETQRMIAVRKLLMMSAEKRIPLNKIHHCRHVFGIPDDFRDRVLKYPEHFRVSVDEDGRPVLELVEWDSLFVVSTLERDFVTDEDGVKRAFRFPFEGVKSLGLDVDNERKLNVLNTLPLVSPYSEGSGLKPWSLEAEKYRV